MRLPLLAVALSTGLAGAATAQTAPPPPPTMQDGMPGPGGPGGPGGGMHGGGGLMQLLMHADANGDGVITREEVIAAADARFAQLDANHDGVLTPEEMRGGMPMRPAGAPAGTGPGAGAPPPRAMMQPITRQQYRDRVLRQFDRIDVNHDGRIDRTEIANYREAMRERRQERRDGGGGDMTPPPAGQPQ